MTCSACLTTIETAVKVLDGVKAVKVSLPLSQASVAHYSSLISQKIICETIEQSGYRARHGTRTAQENLQSLQYSKELEQQKSCFGNAVTLASTLSMVEWLRAKVPINRGFNNILCVAQIATGLWVQLVEAEWIHVRAWRQGWLRAPNMDTLISLSLVLGIALSIIQLLMYGVDSKDVYWSSGSLLTAVILGGRYINTLLKRQTAKGIAQLYALQCEAVMVKVQQHDCPPETNDHCTEQVERSFTRVPAILLQPGDKIYIEAGGIIPCDCYITSGVSIVDQATMTGESLPERKEVGDFLMSGTRNMASQVTAIVCKTQDESALEQLVASISTATEDPMDSSATNLVNTHFVRLIIAIASFCAYWSLSLPHSDISTSVKIIRAGERAMAVLASACPCALGLAIPTAVMSAISVATSRGVLLRGGYDVIRKLATVTHIVMDKTGTLTTGQLSVAEVIGTIGASTCMCICAAERADALTHPVARTVFQWALQRLNEQQRHSQQSLTVLDLQSELGKGVACAVKHPVTAELLEVHIGSSSFLSSHNILVPDSSASTTIEGKVSATIEVHIALSKTHVAMLHLRDTPRVKAAAVVSKLRNSLSLHTSLLTGDSIHEATRIATFLDIPVLAASALPQQKVAHISALQSTSSNAVIAMLGDGLNDAPALAAADVGILLSPGLSRSNAALMGVANVVITSGELERVAEAVVIAKKTVRLVAWNWWWAVLYNVLAVSLAAGFWEKLPVLGGRVDAKGAGMLMAGSSVSVVGWSLWFRRSLAISPSSR